MIDPEFLAAARQSIAGERLFYFAYGGIKDPPAPNVKVVTCADMIKWFEGNPDGQRYMQAWKPKR